MSFRKIEKQMLLIIMLYLEWKDKADTIIVSET